MINVLCIYLVNIYLIFSILYILYGSVMAGRTPGSGRGRGKPRKHGLSPCTRALPTTSTLPASTTPTSDRCSVPPDPHSQEFVMIPNSRYHNSEPQSSFSQEVRPAVSLLLHLPLPPVSLVHKVLKPPYPPPHQPP